MKTINKILLLRMNKDILQQDHQNPFIQLRSMYLLYKPELKFILLIIQHSFESIVL